MRCLCGISATFFVPFFSPRGLQGVGRVCKELSSLEEPEWRLLGGECFLNHLLLPPAEKKDTVLRQVRLDPCDLQPIFDDMLHILNPEELHVIEEIPQAEDKLDRLFEIAGVKSQEASQTLLDSVYSHLPDLL